MDRIKLANGKTVLASMVNHEYLMDIGRPYRKGMGAVVCEDAIVQGEMRFVVWTVFPDGSRNNWQEFPWIAEHGYYMLTWDQACAEMMRRWQQYGIWQNLGQKHYTDTEPF